VEQGRGVSVWVAKEGVAEVLERSNAVPEYVREKEKTKG